MPKPIVISIHIPKTAGTTLEGIYSEVYGEKHFRVPNSGGGVDYSGRTQEILDWDKIKCVSGHMSYGIHAVIPNRQPRYITFLRDPADRLMSLFYYIKRRPRHSQYKWTHPLGFYAWLKTNRISAMDNSMTRFLAGRSDVGTVKPIYKVKQADYDQAKENLSGFAFIGLTEQFDKDIHVLADILIWNIFPQYTNKLVQKRKKADKLPKEVLDFIRDNNKYDYTLLQYVMGRRGIG